MAPCSSRMESLKEVGPSRRLENLAQARHAIEINAAGRVVMPGFVDAHTHLAFPPAGIREAEPAAAVRALHTATGHRLAVRSRAYLEAMARHGTTTVEVKTACGLDGDAEAKLLRMLWALRRDPIDVLSSFLFRLPSDLKGDSSQATEWVATDLLPKVLRRRVASFADLAWDCDPALLPCFDRYLSAARNSGSAARSMRMERIPPAPSRSPARHSAASIDHCEHATELPRPRACRSRHHRHAAAQRYLRRRPGSSRARIDRRRRGSRAGHQLQSAPFAGVEYAGGGCAGLRAVGNDHRGSNLGGDDQRCVRARLRRQGGFARTG